MKAILTALAILFASSAATAGPIGWSYASSGAQEGQYQLDPALIPFITNPGGSQDIYLIGGWRNPIFHTATPPGGPTLWTDVTISDAGSGRSGTVHVPILFTDYQRSQVDGWFQYVPVVGRIEEADLVLGEHRYAVTNGPDHGLTVRVEGTPEPGSLALAGIGLAAVLVRRARRVKK